jgi:hypothetical protein
VSFAHQSALSDRPADRPDMECFLPPDRREIRAVSGVDYDPIPGLLNVSSGDPIMMPNNKQGTMGVRKLRTLLTERDYAILGSIEDHRFLSSKQIYQLHFWDHASYVSGIRACNRVLTRLREHKLISRQERQIGGATPGSSSYVWGIDAAGDRLLRRNLSRRMRPVGVYAASSMVIPSAGWLIQACSGRARIFGLWSVLKRSGFLALAASRVAVRSSVRSAARP